jgi:transposase
LWRRCCTARWTPSNGATGSAFLKRSGERAGAMYSLITTAKLNVDPQAWLADVLRRINDHPASRLDELLPWNWKGRSARLVA